MESRVIDQTASERLLHRTLYLLKFLRALVLHFTLLFIAIALHAYADIDGVYSTADGFIAAMDAGVESARQTLPDYGPAIWYVSVSALFTLWILFLVFIYISVTNVWRPALRAQAVVLLAYALFVLYSFWQAFQFSLAELAPVFSALLLLSVSLIQLFAVDGALGLWKISNSPERSSFLATLDPRLVSGGWSYLLKLLDIPRTPLRDWRTLAAFTLGVAAAVLLMISLAQWINAGGAYGQAFALKACHDAQRLTDCSGGASSWAYETLAWLAAAALGFKLAAYLLAAAKRLGGLSVSDVLKHPDDRFVLYLRPFDADEVVLPSPRLPALSRLVSLRSFPARVEDELFDVCDGYRPLIAVGRPGRQGAEVSGGAYRTYLEDEGWRDYVLDRIRSAERVVIVLKNTAGIRWELTKILAEGALSRTLFLFDPIGADRDRWVALVRSLTPVFQAAGVPLSLVSFQGHPLAFCIQDGQVIEFTNANWSATSYRTAFSSFLAERWRDSAWE